MTGNRQDENYMLVLDERVYYAGLLGHKMNDRRMGAVAIYLAPDWDIRVKMGQADWVSRPIAIVPPFQPHQVISDGQKVICILIEPEQLAAGEIDTLVDSLNDPQGQPRHIARMKNAAQRLVANSGSQTTVAEFDKIVLGRQLRHRGLDPRIMSVISDLRHDGLEHQSLAVDLAESIGLSTSRFLHLFNEQTDVSFRNFRMWRRARTFLWHANRTNSLTDVALSLGYPDSSHFSHSIRKTYGLQPRSIRVGSQQLMVEGAFHDTKGEQTRML
jgi:AraC-like DNA-binding protein